jgi:hypothetical protein
MFLLIDNALNQHGHTIDPGDGQAQRHHMLYHEDKSARKKTTTYLATNIGLKPSHTNMNGHIK